MERRLVAILLADVVGYSRLMGEDEAGTLERLKVHRREIMDPAIAAFHGRIIKLMGDGTLVEFASVVDAVKCAVAIQRALLAADGGSPSGNGIQLRIGINLGDVIVEGNDLYGDGVNLSAARLETLAEPGGICISGTADNQTIHKAGVSFESLGELRLKNIADPVRAYRVLFDQTAPTTCLPSLAEIQICPHGQHCHCSRCGGDGRRHTLASATGCSRSTVTRRTALRQPVWRADR